jgi:hypothetical protein
LKKQHERKEVTSHKPEKDMRRDETHILTWKDNNLAKDRHTLKQQTLPSSKLERIKPGEKRKFGVWLIPEWDRYIGLEPCIRQKIFASKAN